MNVQKFPLTRDKADRLLLEQDKKLFEWLRTFVECFGLALRHDDRQILRIELVELTLSILELAASPVTTPEGIERRHGILHRCQRISEIAHGDPGVHDAQHAP